MGVPSLDELCILIRALKNRTILGPGEEAVSLAEKVLRVAVELGLYPNSVHHTLAGAVVLEFSTDKLYADIEVDDTGAVYGVMSDRTRKVPHSWEMVGDAAIKAGLEDMLAALKGPESQ